MRIGVIGSGQVGQTLAQGLKKHGYETRIASRSPEKLAGFSASSGIEAGTPADVAAWAEAVVLAVKGDAAEAALREAGAANVNGKLVIDTTNPIAHEPPEDGVLRYFTSPNDSLMERLQAAFPDAKLVKAFNSVGSPLMVNPVFPGGAKPTMFYCGNDAGAKAIAKQIRALAQSQDVLLLISHSSGSGTAVQTIQSAHDRGVRVIVLCTDQNNDIQALLDRCGHARAERGGATEHRLEMSQVVVLHGRMFGESDGHRRHDVGDLDAPILQGFQE